MVLGLCTAHQNLFLFRILLFFWPHQPHRLHGVVDYYSNGRPREQARLSTLTACPPLLNSRHLTTTSKQVPQGQLVQASKGQFLFINHARTTQSLALAASGFLTYNPSQGGVTSSSSSSFTLKSRAIRVAPWVS